MKKSSSQRGYVVDDSQKGLCLFFMKLIAKINFYLIWATEDENVHCFSTIGIIGTL